LDEGSAPNIPDVFTDGLAVAVGPFGFQVLLLKSAIVTPGPAGSQSTPINHPVATLRFSRDFAVQFHKSLEEALKVTPPPPGQVMAVSPASELTQTPEG
jgi:hypothetical protein